MDTYKLKSSVVERLEANGRGDRLQTLLAEAADSLLPWEEIQAYREVDPANARLRFLLDSLDQYEAWRLLWLPPSLPYYRLEGALARASEQGFTKRLIFSSWNVVPKAIASLVSYEAERRIHRAFDPDATNTPEERKRRRPLLRFAYTDRRLTGMPVLGLLYPSPSLARLADPADLARGAGTDGPPSLDELLGAARERLRAPLQRILRHGGADEREDESWYWAAPILLDLERDRESTEAWLGDPELAGSWAGGESDEEDGESRWADHVTEATKLLRRELALGRPPEDLLEVLALLAVAGPATCTLRALSRAHGGPREAPWLGSSVIRTAAGRVAWSFRSLFNLPEALSLIRTDYEGEKVPYWRQVLEHSARGHLQAVLDEYVHVLTDLEGLFHRPREAAFESLSERLSQVVALRAGTPRVDEISQNGRRSFSVEARRFRAHFAVRFGSQESDDDTKGAREEQVRAAFNSPFWPFVLASTSIGQEGLDFHPYCHAIVHWNLPSNPVDLEQREGRVHRYKGHAVRKNVAQSYGDRVLGAGHPDPWGEVFERARADHEAAGNGLAPYWIFDLEGGARVERYVPALPLSRETRQLDALRRSLAVYRMVFGQPKQDDLLAYLADRLGEERLAELRGLLQIDLTPGPPNSNR
jgi:hypothetical protein